MQNNTPKVLMLGWEFPPIINGGLGVACHDLCAAMSKFAHVTMIIPRSSPEFKMRNVNLIGMNSLDPRTLRDIHFKLDYQLFSDVHYVDAELNPYHIEEHGTKVTHTDKVPHESQISDDIAGFKIDNLYGGDVSAKVIQFARLAARLAANIDFDVIHAHDWMTMVAGMEIKAQTGKPLVVHVHSLEYDRSGPESRGWVYQIEKAGMEMADLLLPVSNYTANIITEHYGISEEKVFAVHNGIRSVEPFKSPRVFPEKTVLFIGRLTRQKGPEHFLEIASKVMEKDPNVRFVMAGTGEFWRRLLEDSAYRHLGNRFHLTGFLNSEKLKYLLSVSDVYCMPSISEPFGLSAVEAAQFGVPCVISKQSGVAEVLNGALKFDFWDTTKAADYILNLLKNPVLAEKIVQDARQNLDHISWDISAKKVMDAYTRHRLITTPMKMN
jgi:glycosyltransferase involved in cell wall biosynthesis